MSTAWHWQCESGVPNDTDIAGDTLYDGCGSGGIAVLTTIVTVLIVLWLLGLATSYTIGGLIHILLVVAIIAVLLRVIQGRNPLRG